MATQDRNGSLVGTVADEDIAGKLRNVLDQDDVGFGFLGVVGQIPERAEGEYLSTFELDLRGLGRALRSGVRDRPCAGPFRNHRAGRRTRRASGA